LLAETARNCLVATLAMMLSPSLNAGRIA